MQNLEKLIKVISLLNALLIIVMMIISLFVDIFMSLEYFIIRGYIMFFAVVLLLSECNFKYVVQYFFLMGTVRGRAIFTLFIGTLMLNKNVWFLIPSITSMVIGVTIIILTFTLVKDAEPSKHINNLDDPLTS